jgi:cytosine deaminase
MDLILRNARIAGGETGPLVDIGVDTGRIAAVQPHLEAHGEALDLEGRLVSAGFVESHIHLDKSCLLDRCSSERGDLSEAIEQVGAAKKEFTPQDVHDRAVQTLEKSILHGTTHMRTHLEVDPGIGLRSLEGILPLIKEYEWAIDLQVCVFPQEGMTNNPGTEELMVEALRRGARAVGAAPYTDTDPFGQIDRVFNIAREYDVDIDMHMDFGETPEGLHVDYVCDLAEKFDYQGRVTVGHVTKLSMLPLDRLETIAQRLAATGVAATILPSTDLYLMGRNQECNIARGVTPAHRLLNWGVNCSLSTNNVLNPFTPFGDCSLLRMANLYANVCQVGKREDILECFQMVTARPAQILRLPDYGIQVGNPADLTVLDCIDPASAVSEIASPLYGFKRGRRTFTRKATDLHRPR